MIKHLPIFNVGVAAAIVIVTRFSNPDMAETRLLIEFWPRWVVVFGLCFLSIWIAKRS